MPVSKVTLALLCAAVLLVVPATAAAQERDPDADSPSGQVYAIPLETARGDAAPRGGKGSAGGSGDSSTSSGGGQSSTGGGDVSSGTDGTTDGGEASGLTSGSGGGSGSTGGSGSSGGSGSGEEGGSGSGGETPETSAIRSENGFGSSSRVPGLDGNPTVALNAVSDPSGSRVYGLLLLGVLLAAGVGLASRSARRTH